MRNLSILENKEIFELKKKCKVVQDKISRVVDNIPVGDYIIKNNIKKEEEKREGQKENETRSLQN
jgi:hypothetical protein